MIALSNLFLYIVDVIGLQPYQKNTGATAPVSLSYLSMTDTVAAKAVVGSCIFVI